MEKFQVYALFMCLLTVQIFPPVQGTICNLQMDTYSTGANGCDAKGFSAYPAYSCRPCGVSGGQEVHIINMYQPIGGNIPVNILTNHNVNMKLILSSHQIVHWKINKPGFVKISEVIMMGEYSDHSSVSLTDGGRLNVTSSWRSSRLIYDAGLMQYAATHLGQVTFYSAVYETCSWWLRVGNCPTSQADQNGPVTVPELTWTPPDITDCAGILPCWVKYNFSSPRLGKCTGDQYITWYKIEDTTTYFIGAILCTKWRYSLFMSTSLQDRFLDIADSNGQGEDHCELVGMDKEYLPKVEVELENTFVYVDMGYSRYNWGGAFRKGYLLKQRAKWYECGITIPDLEKPFAKTETKPTNIALIVAIVMVVVFFCCIAVLWGRQWWKNRRTSDVDQPQETISSNTESCVVDRSSTIHWVPPSEVAQPERVPLQLRLRPLAPPESSTPPAPSAPSAPLSVVRAPPGYEDALTYPLVPGPKVETPPPAYISL